MVKQGGAGRGGKERRRGEVHRCCLAGGWSAGIGRSDVRCCTVCEGTGAALIAAAG